MIAQPLHFHMNFMFYILIGHGRKHPPGCERNMLHLAQWFFVDFTSHIKYRKRMNEIKSLSFCGYVFRKEEK